MRSLHPSTRWLHRPSPRRAPISRSLDGDFTHLLPERLSFTQIEQLLSDPLSWTLERALGIKRGFSFNVPTGNRMIGTFVHAIVEELVGRGAPPDGAVPSTQVIAETFDRFVPRFASELLLPGQKARLGTIRSTVLASLASLFTTVQERGITLTGAEAAFTRSWELTVDGGLKTVELGGMRDLEGAIDDGRPVIIDLKWANSGKRYRTMVDEGRSRAVERLLPHGRRQRRREPADRLLPAQAGSFRVHRLRS